MRVNSPDDKEKRQDSEQAHTATRCDCIADTPDDFGKAFDYMSD